MFCIFCIWLGAGRRLYLHGAIDPGVLGCTNGCAIRGLDANGDVKIFYISACQKLWGGLQAVSLLDQSCSAQAGESWDVGLDFEALPT